MSELRDVLSLISTTSWLMDLTSLLLFLAVARRHKAINSSLITMIVILVSGSLMLSYEAFWTGYIANHPGFSAMVNFFWYVGFAAFYLLAIMTFRWVHELVKVHLGLLAKYASVSFGVAGLIQLARYLEISIFSTNKVLSLVYKIGIPTIQVATTLVCLGLALYSFYVVFIKNTRPESLRWNI